jgi:hypothetical protein
MVAEFDSCQVRQWLDTGSLPMFRPSHPVLENRNMIYYETLNQLSVLN